MGVKRMRIVWGPVLLAWPLALLPLLAVRAADPPAAEEVSVNWDLGDLYPGVEAWSAAYGKTREQADQLDRFKGSLSKDAQSLLKALATISDVRRESARLATYANLQGDEDTRVAPAQERRQQAQALQTLIDEKTAWLAPEVIALGQSKVDSFLGDSAELKQRFDFFLKNTLRGAPHTLGPEAEGVLAASGNVLSQPNSTLPQIGRAHV